VARIGADCAAAPVQLAAVSVYGCNDLPSDAEALRVTVLDAFDRQRQVDLAERLVARHHSSITHRRWRARCAPQSCTEVFGLTDVFGLEVPAPHLRPATSAAAPRFHPGEGRGMLPIGALPGSSCEMKALAHRGEVLAATLLLLAPAMWNGFPFLQFDSGGYLARWFEGYLEPSRSTVYGLFAVAGWRLDFWPEMLLQAAAAVWIISLVLRAHGLRDRPLTLLGTVAVLAATTSLPWIAGIVLTDVFAGTAVLALYLLLFAPAALSRRETAGLVLLVGFSAATHSATLAVLMAIVAAAGLARLYRRDLLPLAALGRGAGALVLGVAMLLGANFALSGQLAWTPGGYGIVFARMMEDGIVARYLDDHCPDPRLRLCPYRHKLPRTADEFLWKDGPFSELGGFAGLGDEMRTVVLESLAEYPGEQIETAIAASAKQLVRVKSGEGVVTTLFHTYGIIERYMPTAAPAMRAARQQHGEVSFHFLNEMQVPLALISMLLLPVIVLAGRGEYGDLRLLAATVIVAMLANAVVCGVMSNPHDRYGARLAWIATFAVALVPMRYAVTQPSKTGARAEA
jgi:hypothetical protein